MKAVRTKTSALAGLLLASCTGQNKSLGQYPDTDGTGGATEGTSGGTDCTGDCQSEIAVAYISGLNAAGETTVIVAPPCEGSSCPAPLTTVNLKGETFSRCQERPEAVAFPFGPDEWCRLAPAFFGLDVGFTAPIDRDSIELRRPNLEDPTYQEEPYLWHSGIVHVEGPGTMYTGDVLRGEFDRIAVVAARNLACMERLDAAGTPWTKDTLEALCSETYEDTGRLVPLRMKEDMTFRPHRGQLDTLTAACDTPDAGPDTCCNVCDFLLGVAIEKYGETSDGVPRNPHDGTAIACDPGGDPLVQCRDFRPSVDRSLERRSYTYAWTGPEQSWSLPLYDKVRETHPDDRPAGLEAIGAPCTSDNACLDGQSCIGKDARGQACSTGVGCTNKVCRPEWVVSCVAFTHTLGPTGYCVDARHDDRGAAACFVTTAEAPFGSAGTRLAACDTDVNSSLTATECCHGELGGAATCDPLFQTGVAPVARFDRHAMFSPEAHCVCEDPDVQPDVCQDVIQAWCEAPTGTQSDPELASPTGQYALSRATKIGNPRWRDDDEAMYLSAAQLGGIERAGIEACAAGRGIIGHRNHLEGWRLNDAFVPHTAAEHDLALCSGSTYRIVFADSSAQEHLRSATGAAMDGRETWTFETPQFRAFGGGSLTPETVGACDTFGLSFTNRMDLGVANQNKISLWEVRDGTLVRQVAGGSTCDPAATAEDVAAGIIPCLMVDFNRHYAGEVRLDVDVDRHGSILEVGKRYRIVVPGLATIDDMADPNLYDEALHDVCGMPLVLGETPEQVAFSTFEFTVDEPCP